MTFSASAFLDAPDEAPEPLPVLPDVVAGEADGDGTLLGSGDGAPSGWSASAFLDAPQSGLSRRIVRAESGNNPAARNPRSSATGAGQFIDATWLDVLKRNDPDRAAGRSDPELLAMRTDPDLSGRMVDAYARENGEVLSRADIIPDEPSLYLAHFLGPQGAVKVLQADPATPMSALVTRGALRANPFLARRTAGDMYGWAAGKIGPANDDGTAQRLPFRRASLDGVDPATLMQPAPSAAPATADPSGMVRLASNSATSPGWSASAFLDGPDAPAPAPAKGGWSAGAFLDAPANDEPGFFGHLGRSIERGFRSAQQGTNVLGAELGLDDDPSERLSELERKKRALAPPQSVQRFNEAKTFGEAFDRFTDAPLEITANLAAESLPQSIAGIGGAAGLGLAAGAVAGPAGALVGAAAGMGAGSFAQEYTSSILEQLPDKGYDPTKAEDIRRAFHDPAFLAAAREKATLKGVPVAVFDALSLGLAGKLSAGLAGKGVGKAAQWGAELAAQSGYGMAGEATGQLASEGKITQPAAVLAEGLVEIPHGVGEAAAGRALRRGEIEKATPQPSGEVPQGAVPAEVLLGREVGASGADSSGAATVLPSGVIQLPEINVRAEESEPAAPAPPALSTSWSASAFLDGDAAVSPARGESSPPAAKTGTAGQASETLVPVAPAAIAESGTAADAPWSASAFLDDAEAAPAAAADGRPDFDRTPGEDADLARRLAGRGSALDQQALDALARKHAADTDRAPADTTPAAEGRTDPAPQPAAAEAPSYDTPELRQQLAETGFTDEEATEIVGRADRLRADGYSDEAIQRGLSRAFADRARERLMAEPVPDPVQARREREAARRPQGPVDLTTFLRQQGGLQNPGGDLRAMDAQRRGLLRKGGMRLDDAGQAAFEAGYFSERPTTAELLDAIDDNLRGTPRWADQDLGAVQDREDRAAARRADDELNALKDRARAVGFAEHEINSLDPLALQDHVEEAEAIRAVEQQDHDHAHTVEQRVDAIHAGPAAEGGPGAQPNEAGRTGAPAADREGPDTPQAPRARGEDAALRGAPARAEGAQPGAAEPVAARSAAPPNIYGEADARTVMERTGMSPERAEVYLQESTRRVKDTIWKAIRERYKPGEPVTAERVLQAAQGVDSRITLDQVRSIMPTPEEQSQGQQWEPPITYGRTATLASERTAQGEQTLFPGVRPVTDRDRLDTRAERPMRSDRAQRPADEGLFDVGGRGQQDLVERARGAPAQPGEVNPPPFARRNDERPQRAREPRAEQQDQVDPEKRAYFASRAREELDRLGLKQVGVRLERSILNGAADAYYDAARRAVVLADDMHGTVKGVVHHEAVHALRDLGLFTGGEWKVLSRAAERYKAIEGRSSETYAAKAERIYGGKGLSAEQMREEAVALMIQDRADGKPVLGQAGPILARVLRAIEAIGNALRGAGFRSAEGVMGKLEWGEVGRRGEVRDGAEREGTAREMESAVRASAAAEPAYAMRREDTDTPSPAEKQAGLIVRRLREGKPIDQLFRSPFDLAHLTNDKGEFKPGAKLIERATHVLTRASFDRDGRMGWMVPWVEKARAGLIDRYGLDDAYKARSREREAEQRRRLAEGSDFVRSIVDAGAGPEEARILQAMLTGEEIPTGEMGKLAEPIRAAVDEMGQEAVALGLISPEAYQRNRGSYLHRSYMKHEAQLGESGALIGLAHQAMQQRRRGILGDTAKGRGMVFDVTRAKLLQGERAVHGRDALIPEVVKGRKYRVLERMEHPADRADLPGANFEGTRKNRVVERVFLPADEKKPARFGDFEDRGTWEVRGEKGEGKVTLWRDFSKAERAQMGEILDARYTVAKTYRLMAQDLATGRFFHDIATNPTWASKTEPQDGIVVPPAKSQWSSYGEADWVQVPNGDIPGTGGKKRWGALAGLYVRAPIWRDLAELDRMQSDGGMWRTLLSQWKLNKTARSPTVHVNNVMSNVVFMDMADVRMRDLARGLKAMRDRTADFQEAQAHGAFGSDLMAVEFRREMLDPLLAEMRAGDAEELGARFGILGKLGSVLKAVDGKMTDAYQSEDEIFRMATYMRRRALGDDAKTAALAAREQFLDYDIRAPWVNAARRTLLPFLAYTYRAVPVIVKSIALRPWKVAKYATLAYAANALGYLAAGGDEDRDRRLLREQEQGWASVLGVPLSPNLVRLPWNDRQGKPEFIDIRRWVPAGDVMETAGDNSALGAIPAPLHFGGPLAMAFELALNMQAFTGKPITNKLTDDWLDRAGKTTDYLWKSWMPNAAWVPGSWSSEKIYNATVQGGRDRLGNPLDPVDATASAFGVKVGARDPDLQATYRAGEIKATQRALGMEASRVKKDLAQGLISQGRADRELADLKRKQGRLGEKAGKIFGTGSPPP